MKGGGRDGEATGQRRKGGSLRAGEGRGKGDGLAMAPQQGGGWAGAGKAMGGEEEEGQAMVTRQGGKEEISFSES